METIILILLIIAWALTLGIVFAKRKIQGTVSAGTRVLGMSGFVYPAAIVFVFLFEYGLV